MFARDSKYLVLTAMIFAVAMMFVDQTIVAIAIPAIERGLSLSATGSQWVINGYLLALAALFALGGKLSDVLGHRRMVHRRRRSASRASSALCGATPSGRRGEAWLIVFRVVQGAFGAAALPGRARDRRQRVRAARARQGARDLLRHHGRAHLGRADRRQLPAARGRGARSSGSTSRSR